MMLSDGRSLTVIGVTGPSGAGKSALSACFSRRGLCVIDADEVYHRLLLPPSRCLDALTERFGRGILTKDGELNRAALADIVFADGECAERDRKDLNSISHRFVGEEIHKTLCRLAQQGQAAAVIDAPLLIEAGLDKECDLVIAVLALRDDRMKRLLARESKTREALEARLSAQPKDDFYIQHAQVVVQNVGSPELLQTYADAAMRQLGLVL